MIKIDKIYDLATGEEQIIEREETKAEETLRLALEKEIAEQAKISEANAKAKAALLEKLGITEQEAKILLG